MGNMEALVATASLNVSKAELKHINPKLRPPKEGNRVHSSPKEAHREELMAQDVDLNDPRHENDEVDNEGMQIEDGGFWNLEALSFSLPFTLSQKIKATFFPMAAASMDRLSWASSPNGDFDLKKAYKLATMDNDPSLPRDFLSATLSDWLRLNYILHQTSTYGMRWSIVFSFGVWSLWLQQNRVVFKDHITRTSLMTEAFAKASEFAYLGLNDKVRHSIIPIQVQWFPPPNNWFKLNSDGSSMGNLGKAGEGGIIRNSHRDWVSGYARAIGYTTSVIAEV
nr:putative ribonuclease h protein [Quercus suber]POF10141.1 putative ribonuclease h protein [Quercus suber]